MKNKILLYRVLGILMFLTNVLYAYKTIYEYIKVGILKNILFYPFGCDCDVPYYFDTPQLYSNVMLTQGIIFTLLSGLGIIAVIKSGYKLTAIFVIITVLFFIAVLINRQIV